MKVTTKVTICLHVNKMVYTAKMAEYKWEAAYSAPVIIMIASNIGQAVKPSQSKVTIQSSGALSLTLQSFFMWPYLPQ